MAVYNVSGTQVDTIYLLDGDLCKEACTVNGNSVYVNYGDFFDYEFTEVWTNSIDGTYPQGFDVKDNMVFWVSKNGNDTIPADCYVFDLDDGSSALSTDYITVYSGHGNNLSFADDENTLIASPAYPPSKAYVNTFDSSYAMTLSKTLVLNDGSTDCDVCFDPDDDNIIYSLGHTGNSQQTDKPFIISKWDISHLSDNGDGTFTPQRINSVATPQPLNTYFFQGCKYYAGLLWFASGYYTASTSCYVYGVSPITGNVIVTINCNTTKEPEGLAWVDDVNAPGGVALYVGFEKMMMRKYTFNSL